MKSKLPLWALVFAVMLSIFFGPVGLAAAQADDITSSLAGCTVTVSFVATAQVTYFFDVFDSGLLFEQSYTPVGPDEIPADVSFSYTYSGAFPAPSITIVLSASDDVLQQFDISGDALTASCQPPAPGENDGDPDGEPGGETPVSAAQIPCGPDLSEAVVGSFILPADFYAAPGVLTDPLVGVAPGKTAWVLGMDPAGEYYKIAWGCEQLWVLVDTMAPNYDSVWNGMALPTNGLG